MTFEEWQRYHLRIADALKPAAMRGLQSAALRVIPLLHARTRTAPPQNPSGVGRGGAVDTGMFLRGWKSTAQDDATVLIYNSVTDGRAPTQEYGRRAGSAMPPPAVVEAWLRRRLGMGAREAKRAAFPIARAIGRRGLLPRRILTANEFQERIAEVVAEEVQMEIATEFGHK